MSARWPFGALRPHAYGVLLVDPPWRFAKRSRRGEVRKMARHHYRTMSLADMMALPVAELAAPDCALALLVTAPFLDRGLEVLAHWGFAFKSAGAWAKQSPSGENLAFGTGYLYRNAAEFWLLGTRGHPSLHSRSVRNLIVAPRREHSRKPDQLASDLERLFGWRTPRCELFARTDRLGWDCWGDEVGLFDEIRHAA